VARHGPSTLRVQDAAGPVLHDRFVLAGARDWSARGFTDGHAYFGSLAVIADRGLDAVLDSLPCVAPAGATLGGARLARRGVLVRCVAGGAPALTEALHAAWTLARRTVLDVPPLALRKS